MKTFILATLFLVLGFHQLFSKERYYINEIYPLLQEAHSPLVINTGDSIVLQAWIDDYGNSYPIDVIWLLNGNPLNTVPSNSIVVSDTGIYNYYQLHSSLHIVYSTTGINENDNSKIISLLQNPVSDKLILNLTEPLKLNCKLFDYSGKEVLSTVVSDIGRNEVEISNLCSGIYFLEVSNKDVYFRRKIVKE